MKVPPPILTLAERIAGAGGRLYVVGGAVRDHLLGLPPKDLDFEVHGLNEEALERLLHRQGTARHVGRTFPVFKVALPGLNEVDVALPRAGSTGQDPLAEASRHRDLTLNAMLFDPLTREVFDPWNGTRDLAARRLRAVDSATFVTDPIRALRVAVLAARLKATPDPDLVQLCRGADLSSCAAERVGMEFQKLWLRAPNPEVGLDWLDAFGLLPDVLPGLTLSPEHRLAITRAAAWREDLAERGPGPRLALCWAVLLTGHPEPRQVLDRADVYSVQRWPVRERVLSLLTALPSLPTDDTALRTLAEHQPTWLALRRHAAWHPESDALARLARASLLGISTRPLPTLLEGRDLMALGVEPGPVVGRYLAAARAAQLAGLVETSDQARTWVERRIGCDLDALPAGDEPAS